MVNQKWMHTLVTQVLGSSNKFYSTHISRIFGFHSRLKSKQTKSGKKSYHRFNRRHQFSILRLNAVTEAWTLSTPVKPTIFEINVVAVVQNVGFPGISKLILTG